MALDAIAANIVDQSQGEIVRLAAFGTVTGIIDFEVFRLNGDPVASLTASEFLVIDGGTANTEALMALYVFADLLDDDVIDDGEHLWGGPSIGPDTPHPVVFPTPCPVPPGIIPKLSQSADGDVAVLLQGRILSVP